MNIYKEFARDFGACFAANILIMLMALIDWVGFIHSIYYGFSGVLFTTYCFTIFYRWAEKKEVTIMGEKE